MLTQRVLLAFSTVLLFAGCSGGSDPEPEALAEVATTDSLTIAIVNNGHMINMQTVAQAYTDQTGIALNWVTLEETVLQEQVASGEAGEGMQYDVINIGMQEAPFWGAQGWIKPLTFSDAYDLNDVFPSIRTGFSSEGSLYATPFYGESSMLMYNSALANAAAVIIDDNDSWANIELAAAAMHNPQEGIYGACLRGRPGWGDNMAPITTVANTFGAQWFDADGMPQLDSPAWNEALTFYKDLVTECGPPGVTGNSFPESLALMSEGKAGMWVDATVAAGFLAGTEAGPDMGQALAPVGPVEKGNAWLWSWNLGIPAASDAQDEAFRFLMWATSKEYQELVAAEKGWAAVPPGTRQSLYERAEYLEAAPFAEMTLGAILKADPTDSTLNPTIAAGVQYVAIPEFSAIGQDVAQEVAAALAGDISVEEALARAQRIADEAMQDAGYY